MSIGKIDKRLTDEIRKWGSKHYGFWSSIAGYPVLMYTFFALVLDLMGWLSLWWHVVIVGAIAYVFTIAIQYTVRRDRPKFEELTPYRMWWRTYSLPSGHAAESASLATILLLLTTFPTTGYAVVFGGMFIIFALLIGISRLVVGVHYLADVIVGFALGILVAILYAQAVL